MSMTYKVITYHLLKCHAGLNNFNWSLGYTYILYFEALKSLNMSGFMSGQQI